jgi:two-component system CheB/CheR fusion protein
MRMMPYRTAADMIDGLVITFVDITRQKEAELEAREARELTSSVIQAMRQPLAVLDQKMQIVLANEALAELLGRPLERLRGQPLADAWAGALDHAGLEQALDRVTSGGEGAEEIEARVQTTAGAEDLRLFAQVLAQADAKPKRILLTVEARGGDWPPREEDCY